MTQQLANYELWSTEQIEERSKELAAMAAEVYPHPNRIVS
jgi:hypothetical protein